MEATEILVIILSAAVGEGIIEFIAVPILNIWVPDEDANRKVRTVILNSCSAVLGVGIALNFTLSLWALLDAVGSIQTVDQVLTGILIGRGSNYLHGLVSKYVLNREQ